MRANPVGVVEQQLLSRWFGGPYSPLPSFAAKLPDNEPGFTSIVTRITPQLIGPGRRTATLVVIVGAEFDLRNMARLGSRTGMQN
jgi:hypothetical protein